jgi:hypothetical protein
MALFVLQLIRAKRAEEAEVVKRGERRPTKPAETFFASTPRYNLSALAIYEPEPGVSLMQETGRTQDTEP